MKKILSCILSLISLISCKKEPIIEHDLDGNKIEVLNIGVFHLGNTSDKHKSFIDLNKEKQNIIDFCKIISEYKPTIIAVEVTPEDQDFLTEDYMNYLKYDKANRFSGEVVDLGFRIGKISNVKKIIGIDYKQGYDYEKIDRLAKKNNYITYNRNHNIKDYDYLEKENFIERIKIMNTKQYYDWIINFNADLLMYVNTKGNFEGADQASLFYERNIKMFANINKIELTKNDKLLVITGAAHAAFFDMFFARSPKYNVIRLESVLNNSVVQ